MPVDPAEPESVDAAESEFVDSLETIEPTESINPFEAAESTEPVEPTEPVESTEPVEPTEPTEPTEPVEPVEEPVEPTEPVEPVEPTELVEEPIEPVEEAVEPVEEPIEPVEEPIEPVEEPTEPVEEATEPVEPVEEPTEPVEPVESTEPVEETTEPVEETTEPPAPSPAARTQSTERSSTPTPRNHSFSRSSAAPVPSQSVPEGRYITSPPPEAYISYPSSPAYHAYASPTYASPVPKARSPLARPYISPMMSPHATPPAQPVMPHAPPSTAPSYTTALHSPVMSSAGMIPPYAPYPPPPQGMATAHRGYMDPYYASSLQAMQTMGLASGLAGGLVNGQARENGTISPPDHGDEHIELLARIQNAIPDLSKLLNGFKDTQSKLTTREAEFQQIQNQHEQALMHKDFYIEALQAQMRKTASESAEESTKLKNTINELRLELGNLQERQRDVEESLSNSEKSNEQLLENKVKLEQQITKLNATFEEARVAHEREIEHRKQQEAAALVAQKLELTELFEEIKAEDEKLAAEALEAREKELLDQQESLQAEWDQVKQKLQESEDALKAELESTGSELDSTKSELEAKISELETKKGELESAMTDLESHRAEIETKHAELESTRADQLAAAAKELEEQQQQWFEERTRLEQELSEKKEELASTEREKDKLEEQCIAKEQQLQHAVEEMRLTIDHLDGDRERLRKTLHSLGEATDLKSTKGDSFFVDCFDQLSHLIVDLSKEHFSYLPIDPPKDILSKIPPELPSFLDNTTASRELRSAYIQHVISKTLTFRIFQPFLFTLGRRYDKADTFFQMLSMDIRRKSVRREAFWRQQTLKAAYTTSDAKQSINVVAAVIVDEIVDHIKHFTDPKTLDTLITAVRKIVKLAAETWRHARVERELVLATLPAPDAEVAVNEEWEEYGTTKERDYYTPNSDPTRHVVLRTFPRIMREAAHEDFADDKEKATSCVYSYGTVLYSDSPIVISRLQELARRSTESLGNTNGHTSS
ncbi:hypothetical protein ASPZODRAFT_67035 [Penicilliopsis zonata CBS 506.65]|uniref:Uncharacterized protein n=1 Tax=Penicilliopsis zonata CBS 506.65 TaxID=1073090 RepID=A0A1L9SGI5_9EURO|nr:hypothetical protein ASPZODRAFT_67035 [Penicilliopsis zonata CBS 506.65]OJJ46282.1 hypothetical protein ASPZODRAFT_67035 [Penicilliopsis zonata CBS 506.65]